MAIYNIFDYYERDVSEKRPHASSQINPDALTSHRIGDNYIKEEPTSKAHLFSAIAARFFFFLLLVADLIWGIYSTILFCIKAPCYLLSFGAIPLLKTSCGRTWLNIKRSLVCGIALFIAIFSPALGIMFSCMYFLMYDKNGIEEVVPASLRDQFKEMFPIG